MRHIDIDNDLLDEARDRQARVTLPLTDDQVAQLTDELKAEARAANMSTQEYLMHRAETVDVSSPPDGAIYWAGRYPDDPSLSNRFVAEAWAERHNLDDPGDPVTTIAMTPGGREMDDRHLFELYDQNNRELRWDREFPGQVWERLSERYSEQTVGEATVFATDAYPHSIFGRTEVPNMRINPDVGADRIDFTFEPPQRLTTGQVLEPPVRDAVGEPGRQARLQLYEPSIVGYVDVAHANALPPDELEAHIDDLCQDVDAADQDRIRHHADHDQEPDLPDPDIQPPDIPGPDPDVPAPREPAAEMTTQASRGHGPYYPPESAPPPAWDYGPSPHSTGLPLP